MSSSHMRMQSQRRVAVSVLLCCLLGLAVGGCGREESADVDAFQSSVAEVASTHQGVVLEITREEVATGVFHYSLLVRVGDTPNARLRLHRVVREQAPWRPGPTRQAVMLLHGDFSTFTSNFLPASPQAVEKSHQGLAVYLAEQGIDVWGMDRRWTTAPAEGAPLSDFPDMGFAAAIDDVGRALSYARALRGRTGSGSERLFLAGFSRGGHLAYAYAASEAQRPRAQRQLKGLIPIDIYAVIAPEDEPLRLGACARSREERALLQAGLYDSDNGWFIQLGTLATASPSEPSPLLRGFTNRGALLAFAAQTYVFYAPQPDYHLTGGVLTDGAATALRYSPEAVVARWLSSAPPHQAMAELADSDALLCGEAPLPVAGSLGDIQVPLFYLGAAGGFGEHGVYSTSLVGSADVTTHVVRRLEAAREAEDFGHADLLYADDAPALAWRPLAAWILRH